MKNDKYTYKLPILVALLTTVLGSYFYHYVEGFSLVDAYYFTVGTMFTVGYGDLAPVSDIGKIFTTFYMVIGVGVIGGLLRVAIQHRVANSRFNHHSEHSHLPVSDADQQDTKSQDKTS